MPELLEQMYCSQQIVIPPKFPYILKRYCKAAIKTQPYDLLQWSMEYFRALAENRPPPVKLRLEWPTYSTEGGLTKGCLKVIAHQLSGISDVPLAKVREIWRGFCLSPIELARILCLCEVFMRADSVPFLHFIACAGGMLTKTLTHTMILLCETLTQEPDGGSAAIPLEDMMTMYRFLAKIDASADVKYYNGYREGHFPPQEEVISEGCNEEENEAVSSTLANRDSSSMEIPIVKGDIPESMIAGRQMSTTSGEFIVQYIEKEIMDHVDEQITILPDPNLRRKKATPEEKDMVRDILDSFLDENMEAIVPDNVGEEDVEEPIPTVITVYAVPGIGPPVDDEIVNDFAAYMYEVSLVQADFAMPRNIRHFMCPPLEKYKEHVYDEKEKDVTIQVPHEDKIPIGGTITE